MPISAKSDATFMKSIIYEKLSRFGVTLSELDTLSNEEIIIFATAQNISVDTKYYHVLDKFSKEVSYSEVQEALKETHEKTATALSQSSSSTSDEETSSGGYLRQRVYISKALGSNSKYFVSYEARWLKVPYWLGTDVFGIAVGNATICPENPKATYIYTHVTPAGQYYPYSEKTYTKKLSSISTFSTGAAVKFTLAQGIPNASHTINHSVHMTYYVTKSSSNVKNISVAGYYKHQKSVFNVSPSITAIGVSAGISITKSNYFTEMTPNPYTALYF